MKHPILMTDIAGIAERLPPFPAVVQRLLAALNEGSLPLETLVRIVRTDPVVSAAILSAANRLRRVRMQPDISDLFAAATLIGTDKLHQIAVITGMQSFLGEGSGQQIFFEHSVAVAIVAQELAIASGHAPGEAFMAGIVHDIGQLGLYVAAPKVYAELRRASIHDGNLQGMEFEAFGFNHSQLGGLLGEHWELPLEIRLAISTHHDRANVRHSPLQAIVNLAETFANALDIPPTPYNCVDAVSESALATLGLDLASDEMADMLGRSRARFFNFRHSATS